MTNKTVEYCPICEEKSKLNELKFVMSTKEYNLYKCKICGFEIKFYVK